MLMFARRTMPVLRVPAWLQRAAAFANVAFARVRRTFSRSSSGGHTLPLPKVPHSYDPLVLVFDAQGCRQVLTDRLRFSVQLYDEKMSDILGRFLLGLDYDNPEYKAQANLWRDIADGRDANVVFAHANAAAQMTALSDGDSGRVDVVDWAARVLECFVGTYFGVPSPTPGAKRRGSALLDLFERVSSYIFNLDLLTGHLYDDAIDAGRTVKRHLTDLVERKSKSPRNQRDVVERLLAQGSGSPVEKERVVNLLAGTLSGLFVPTSSQFVRVVDFLLDLPQHELSTLKAIARRRGAADRGPEDDLTRSAARYVLESARFDPFPMALLRYCADAADLIDSDGALKAIPAKATVVAMMNSAAFDPLLAKQPGSFLTGRPAAHSLVFGAGQHACIGATHSWPIATALMTEMTLRLFALPGLRRAKGRRGCLRYRDSWPSTFELRYDSETPGVPL
jgi:cytochrome P450